MSKIFIVLFSLILTGCGSVSTNHSYGTSYHPPSEPIYKIESRLNEEQKNEIVLFSLNLLDTKYNWGSKRPDFGLDCSGLVSYVFKQTTNIYLPGAARDIVKHGQSVPLTAVNNSRLELGDLLFFNTTGKSYSHVGIYIGKNEFLHASSAKGKVITSSIFNKYYFDRLEVIKRI